MCGISGIAGPAWELDALNRMMSSMRHRGPDDDGVRLLANGRLGFGHNRLSILDLTVRGRQPMSDPTGRVTVVLNGEIYNYVELRDELGPKRFRTGTDTEVLLAAYERWGESCVERFNGMFAFALWDAQRNRLFCARDRLGIKPFHFGFVGSSFVFASEIKALLEAGVPAVPDRQAWATYLVHGVYDHSDATFFDGVASLPPGNCLTIDSIPGGRAIRREDVAIRSYWSLPERAATPFEGSMDDAADALISLLDDSVRLRLRSDVPVGVNLSGGLDSASLMMSVDEIATRASRVETFTAAFDDPAYDESEFAGEVPHQAIWNRNVGRIRPHQVWERLPSVMWHQEAPFGGVATVGYHALHELARDRDVTVLLEGQGVDELFAGYAYFRPCHYRDTYETGGEAAARAAATAMGDDPDVVVAELARPSDAPAPRYQDGTRHLRPECISQALVDLAGAAPTFVAPFPDHLRNALYRDLRHTKLPRVLRMNDRLSMAFGRELREPYLDHRIVELAFRLPGSWKIGAGQHKRLLRRAMKRRLPDPVRRTAKRAVVTPQREWIRGPLSDRIRAVIEGDSFRARGDFDATRVCDEFDRFERGEGDNSFFVWQWLNAELWSRTFVDAEEPGPLEGVFG